MNLTYDECVSTLEIQYIIDWSIDKKLPRYEI